jgi:hypothetical protein
MCRSKAEGGRRCRGGKSRKSSGAVARKTVGGSAPRSPSGPRGPYGPAPGPSGPRNRSGRTRRSRAAVLRDAQKQLGDILDAVINATPVNSPTALLSAVDAYVASQVADKITATLKAHGRPRGSWRSHLLCGALAAVARAMDVGQNAAETVVTKGITSALVAGGMPRPAAGLAGRAATDVLLKLTPIGHWEAVRRAVGLLAVSMCPNVANHPAVENYCLRPLASELLAPAIQQELAESLPIRTPG